MAQRPVKITLEYDGSAYHGWQRQTDQRTVQGELEKALSLLRRTTIPVVGQGRTDSGVHAEAQVAHAFLDSDDIDLNDLRKRLNGLLGATCAVRKLELAPEGFHARYSALARHYRYQIIQELSPLRRASHWYVESELALNPIRLAMAMCEGEHDFGTFCSHSQEMANTRCNVSAFTLDAAKPMLNFHIVADRFLHNMVRRLVGEMVTLGRGLYTIEDFRERLDSEGPAEHGLTAPPHGLYLAKVVYPEADAEPGIS